MKLISSLVLSLIATQAFADVDGAYLDAPYPQHNKVRVDSKRNKNLEVRSNTNAVIELMTDVRSQGSRGTCSIFSAAALIEGLLKIKGYDEAADLSEELLQYQVNAGSTSDGSYATKNFNAIAYQGMASEATLPYISNDWAKFEDFQAQQRCGHLTGTPKTSCLIVHFDPQNRYRTDADLLDETKPYFSPDFVAARKEAAQFKATYLFGATYGSIWNTTEVKMLLARGIPVILEQDFYYGAWNHRVADELNIGRNYDHWNKGIVGYPFVGSMDRQQSPTKRAGHSILLVGYDDTVEIEFPVKMANGEVQTRKLKGVYYFKNSWGTGSFGVDAEIDGVSRPGYGTMTQQYAHDYGSFYKFNLR